ncbi:MAG: hypothetical protein D6757_04425 [Alphaproteobacteria bacterium]|nr:MAG: hypothetical protein D6757_04425 [Alphaproteobacteria bacterium]
MSKNHSKRFLKQRSGICALVSMLALTIALDGSSAMAAGSPQDSGTDAGKSSESDRIATLEKRLSEVLGVVDALRQEVARLKAQKGAGAGAPAGTDLARRIDALSEQVASTDARLDEIEDIAIETDEKVGSRALARVFNADSLDIGGFLHTAATLVDGKQNTEASFNRLTFELLARAKLSQNWSVFVAQAFIRESGINYTDPAARLDPNFNVVSKTPLVIATANYHHSDLLNLEIGRFITPHGIINIEHFPAILLDPEQPQFLRPFGGQTIFANFMNGLKLSGQTFAGFGGKGTLGYAAYAASFVGNSDHFNYGGRLFYRFGDTGFTLGANVGGGKRAGTGTQYWLAGGDLLYDKGPVLWKTELFATDEDAGGNRLAFYTQPAFRLDDQWTAFYRFDFLDDGSGRGDRTEHAVGITFKPDPDIHLRLIARRDHFQAALGLPKANAENYQFSATFSF